MGEEDVVLWRNIFLENKTHEACDLITKSRDIPTGLINAIFADDPLPNLPPRLLTYREREILYLMSVGWDDGHIANALQVSIFTVKTQIKRIRTLLGTVGKNRVYTVAEGLRQFQIV